MSEAEYKTKPLVNEHGDLFWPDNEEDEQFFRDVEHVRELREGEEIDPDRFWMLKK